MPLLLKWDEVGPLLDISRAIEVTEAAFAEQGEGFVAIHGQYALPMEHQRT